MNFSDHFESLFWSQIKNGLGWPFRDKLTWNDQLRLRKCFWLQYLVKRCILWNIIFPILTLLYRFSPFRTKLLKWLDLNHKSSLKVNTLGRGKKIGNILLWKTYHLESAWKSVYLTSNFFTLHDFSQIKLPFKLPGSPLMKSFELWNKKRWLLLPYFSISFFTAIPRI